MLRGPLNRGLHQADRTGGIQDVEQRQHRAHHDVEALAVFAEHRGRAGTDAPSAETGEESLPRSPSPLKGPWTLMPGEFAGTSQSVLSPPSG